MEQKTNIIFRHNPVYSKADIFGLCDLGTEEMRSQR